MNEDLARERAKELLPEAEDVLRVLRIGARRAFVLEVTGTPKAGKTSTLSLIEGFFKRAGYRVYMLRERAADCPIPMKGHFFFNAWTTCTMLSQVLATYDTDVDLIILDRGFFDALIWLGLQRTRGQVDTDEARVFTDFVLLDRWRNLVDLTVLLTADPAKAMEREQKGVLIPKSGSLMNTTALTAFNEQATRTLNEHGDKFKVLPRDSTGFNSAKETALSLLRDLLPRIREWAEQQIVVLPRAFVRQLFMSKNEEGKDQARPFLHGSAAESAWAGFRTNMNTRLRHEVEQDDTLVQIVGCGIVVYNENLFLLRRSSKDEKVSYGRSVLWKGCHIIGDQAVTLGDVANQVKNRVLEEFHLRTDLQTTFLGMAWTETEDMSTESRHLGVMFLVRISDESIAISMQDKEFRKAGRGHVMTGKFQTSNDIIESLGELGLEAWSRFAVENIGLQDPG